jgi:GPH family glycoside/pentoside/hexuronide:cation symporter
MLAAAGATGLLISDDFGRGAAFWLMLGAGTLAAVALIYSVFALPPERADHMGRGGQDPFRAMRDVWANPHARLLLFVFFVESLGVGAIGMLVPFALEYVMETPELTAPMLLFVFVLGIVSVPLWVALAARFEKRRLWLFAMFMSAFGFSLLLFLGEGDWPLMAVSSFFVGLASSCGSVLGQALKAEIIDVDEHRTGERKEGAYFAAWSFVGKLASGVMVFVVGVVLDSVGYVPNQPQTDAVKGWLVFLMGGMPLIGYAIGIPVFLRFRLSESEHARIRAELDARSAAQVSGGRT